MPTANDHLVLALRNLNTLNRICTDKAHCEWIVTISSYTAMHLLESVLFIDDGKVARPLHSVNHADRERNFKVAYQGLWKKYRPLFAASKIARYLQPEGEGKDGQTFAGYYSYDVVQSAMVKRYLGGVIRISKERLDKNADLSQVEKLYNDCVATLDKTWSS